MRIARPAKGFSCRNTQFAVDQGCADALRQRLGGPRIFDQMVVQPDKPAGLWILLLDDVERLDLLGRDHAKRIGEGEVRVGIGVEQDDAETVRFIGRDHHGKDLGP